MAKHVRSGLTLAAVLGAGLLLTACESMDSLSDKLDLFGLQEKRKLQGERKAVFPEGVPGVAQGIPPEMMKGAQPAPDLNPPQVDATVPPPAQTATAEPIKPGAKPVVRNKPTRLNVTPERQKQEQGAEQPQQ